MGGDGGSIPRRPELVKNKAKVVVEVDPSFMVEQRRTTCAISLEPLHPPVVVCPLGLLYNLQSVLDYLQDKKNLRYLPFRHIRSIKDVVNVKYSGEKLNKRNKEDHSIISFTCPMTDLHHSSKQRFVVMRPCGCTLSERALKEMGVGDKAECVVCGGKLNMEAVPGTDMHWICLNRSEQEVEDHRLAYIQHLAREKAMKKEEKEKAKEKIKESNKINNNNNNKLEEKDNKNDETLKRKRDLSPEEANTERKEALKTESTGGERVLEGEKVKEEKNGGKKKEEKKEEINQKREDKAEEDDALSLPKRTKKLEKERREKEKAREREREKLMRKLGVGLSRFEALAPNLSKNDLNELVEESRKQFSVRSEAYSSIFHSGAPKYEPRNLCSTKVIVPGFTL